MTTYYVDSSALVKRYVNQMQELPPPILISADTELLTAAEAEGRA